MLIKLPISSTPLAHKQVVKYGESYSAAALFAQKKVSTSVTTNSLSSSGNHQHHVSVCAGRNDSHHSAVPLMDRDGLVTTAPPLRLNVSGLSS